ncbi:hypothetical protein FVE85_4884 [Porphyridium purpureum]|uniref:Uncharacterized protein n=1 Tax=Porphyridium purpureum TaxID=35688 RepID=A0A5J4YTG4_PORPP|nr:hypothetical protein FVE85_4884 [Porphyridium purpureum]|eukprot:POR3326..scf236_6
MEPGFSPVLGGLVAGGFLLARFGRHLLSQRVPVSHRRHVVLMPEKVELALEQIDDCVSARNLAELQDTKAETAVADFVKEVGAEVLSRLEQLGQNAGAYVPKNLDKRWHFEVSDGYLVDKLTDSDEWVYARQSGFGGRIYVKYSKAYTLMVQSRKDNGGAKLQLAEAFATIIARSIARHASEDWAIRDSLDARRFQAFMVGEGFLMSSSRATVLWKARQNLFAGEFAFEKAYVKPQRVLRLDLNEALDGIASGTPVEVASSKSSMCFLYSRSGDAYLVDAAADKYDRMKWLMQEAKETNRCRVSTDMTGEMWQALISQDGGNACVFEDILMGLDSMSEIYAFNIVVGGVVHPCTASIRVMLTRADESDPDAVRVGLVKSCSGEPCELMFRAPRSESEINLLGVKTVAADHGAAQQEVFPCLDCVLAPSKKERQTWVAPLQGKKEYETAAHLHGQGPVFEITGVLEQSSDPSINLLLSLVKSRATRGALQNVERLRLRDAEASAICQAQQRPSQRCTKARHGKYTVLRIEHDRGAYRRGAVHATASCRRYRRSRALRTFVARKPARACASPALYKMGCFVMKWFVSSRKTAVDAEADKETGRARESVCVCACMEGC